MTFLVEGGEGEKRKGEGTSLCAHFPSACFVYGISIHPCPNWRACSQAVAIGTTRQKGHDSNCRGGVGLWKIEWRGGGSTFQSVSTDYLLH